MDTLTYRLLPQSEWERLRAFFDGEPVFVPPAALGIASVALDENGEIVSAVILQPVSYLGPFRTAEQHRGHVDYAQLKEQIDKVFRNGKSSSLIIKGYIAMPREESVAVVAERAGMERAKCPVLIQTFGGDETLPRR